MDFSTPPLLSARRNLAAALAPVQPDARLVPRFWLRRIIRRHRGMPASAGTAPHEGNYAISRDDLTAAVDPREIGLEEPLPERLLLIPTPSAAELRDAPDTWHRRIEEAVFHDMLDRRFDAVFPSFESTRELWQTIGKSQQGEIRGVLEEQQRTFPEDDNRTVVRETVALFLELWYFDRERLADFFPGLSQEAQLEELFEARLQCRELAKACRLNLPATPPPPPPPAPPAADMSPHDRSKLAQSADRSAAKGNDVRALLIHERVGDEPAAEAFQAHLLKRLSAALGGEIPAECTPAFTAVRRRAIAPDLPPEARLLFDLQNICIDFERPIYAVEVVEWALSRGRKPVKRELPLARFTRVLRHLRAALQHVRPLADADPVLLPLAEFLASAEVRAEEVLREKLRPVLFESMAAVGLEGVNLPERVARDKIVEELLDAVSERGFLRLGDVRDAIARNRLKLDDLSGIREFLKGDALLRLNALLPDRLDGIYQRGEIYLRTFQRGSSLFFGTAKGRLFTKYVALPFGGAFILLEGLHHFWGAVDTFARYLLNNPRPEHVVDKAMKSVYDLLPLRRTMGRIAVYEPQETDWATTPAVLLLGAFLLAMLYVRPFRRAVFRAVTTVFWRWPRALAASPPVQLLVHNPATRWMRKFMLVPLLFGGAATLVLRLLGDSFLSASGFGLTIAALSGFYFRTRAGREVEERVGEFFEYAWRRISLRLIVAVFEAIFFFFKNVMEYVERGIYRVDEWLRFREGENRFVYYFKLSAGLVWFYVAYVFRFGWNLLLEPQINPIKHFPVVTVSHKLLLPLVPGLADTFGTSATTMFALVACVPGVFGFLAWELKENWRLYKRNAPPAIEPAAIGSHGESVTQLLRPGFHSGTIPKAFAGLRNTTAAAKVRAYHAQIHHIEEGLRNFVDRLMLPYLSASKRWEGTPLPECAVWLATNRIGFSFYLPEVADHQPLELLVEDRDGWLIASILNPGWLAKVPVPAAAAFWDILSAALKFCGAAAFKPQAAWEVGCRTDQVDLDDNGLLIRREDGSVTRVTRPEAYLENRPIFWRDWVVQWERDQRGEANLEPVLLRREMV